MQNRYIEKNMCYIKNRNYEYNPFNCDGDRYIWILLNTSGGIRCKELGITEAIYYREDLCNTWYNEIFNKIIQSAADENFKYMAIDKLNWLYNNMMEGMENE